MDSCEGDSMTPPPSTRRQGRLHEKASCTSEVTASLAHHLRTMPHKCVSFCEVQLGSTTYMYLLFKKAHDEWTKIALDRILDPKCRQVDSIIFGPSKAWRRHNIPVLQRRLPDILSVFSGRGALAKLVWVSVNGFSLANPWPMLPGVPPQQTLRILHQANLVLNLAVSRHGIPILDLWHSMLRAPQHLFEPGDAMHATGALLDIQTKMALSALCQQP